MPEVPRFCRRQLRCRQDLLDRAHLQALVGHPASLQWTFLAVAPHSAGVLHRGAYAILNRRVLLCADSACNKELIGA